MTCTHAALKRREFLEIGFKYDNLIMEESAQILEIESFIPMLLQVINQNICFWHIANNFRLVFDYTISYWEELSSSFRAKIKSMEQKHETKRKMPLTAWWDMMSQHHAPNIWWIIQIQKFSMSIVIWTEMKGMGLIQYVKRMKSGSPEFWTDMKFMWEKGRQASRIEFFL